MTACKCFWYTSTPSDGCVGPKVCSCDWGGADSTALSRFWSLCGHITGYKHIEDKSWVDCAVCPSYSE